jgi:hypothetical protein
MSTQGLVGHGRVFTSCLAFTALVQFQLDVYDSTVVLVVKWGDFRTKKLTQWLNSWTIVVMAYF